MKRYIVFLFVLLFGLTACTLTVPDIMNVEIVSVEHQEDGTLVVFIRNAEDGYRIYINGEEFDCFLMADNSGILECKGPGFKPGEELVIKFYEEDGDLDPVAELTITVPDYPEGQDADGDGIEDAKDGCPGNPDKDDPGFCGCGVPETDTDGDGTPDCVDACPNNPDLVEKGDNGCDPAPKDTDKDGSPDEGDLCPEDPDKVIPGVCGCGVPDDDKDEDGVADCEDQCPDLAYADKIGDPCDKDEDDDGVFDGGDMCPYNPDKFDPGDCGCDVPETDTDGDGTPDCVDLCPKDAKKTEPGKCGCGRTDRDTDKDGVPDCKDKCPSDPNDPVGDPCCHDEDCDGWDDWIDECPYDPTTKHKPCGTAVPCP